SDHQRLGSGGARQNRAPGIGSSGRHTEPASVSQQDLATSGNVSKADSTGRSHRQSISAGDEGCQGDIYEADFLVKSSTCLPHTYFTIGELSDEASRAVNPPQGPSEEQADGAPPTEPRPLA